MIEIFLHLQLNFVDDSRDFLFAGGSVGTRKVNLFYIEERGTMAISSSL